MKLLNSGPSPLQTTRAPHESFRRRRCRPAISHPPTGPCHHSHCLRPSLARCFCAALGCRGATTWWLVPCCGRMLCLCPTRRVSFRGTRKPEKQTGGDRLQFEFAGNANQVGGGQSAGGLLHDLPLSVLLHYLPLSIDHCVSQTRGDQHVAESLAVLMSYMYDGKRLHALVAQMIGKLARHEWSVRARAQC